MAAYVIVDIDVAESAGYEEYKKIAPQTVAAYGGKYLARGGALETLEGDWAPKRLVILEFADSAQAKRWYTSPEYATARQVRHKAATFKMIVVDGVQVLQT